MATNARPIGALTRSVVGEIRANLARLEKPQSWLAERSGVPLPTLKKILRKERAVDMEQLDSIARAFDVTPDDFVASALRNSETYQSEQVAVHAAGSSQPGIEYAGHPDEEWEFLPPSEESRRKASADADRTPDN